MDLDVNSAESIHSRKLTVQLSAADGVVVLYQGSGSDRLLVERTEEASTHSVSLARLRADEDYLVHVWPRSSYPDGSPTTTSFTTEPLPADLAGLTFVTKGQPSAPLLLIEINRIPDGFEGVVAIDSEGGVVWHHAAGSVAGSTRRENGNFVVLSGQEGLLVLHPVDGVMQTLPQRPAGQDFHHDVIPTPWNTLYVLSHDTATVGDSLIVGEAILEWDPEAGTTTKRWTAFDHLSWELDQGWGSRAGDWLHANALAIGPSGNVTMSLAFMDEVISITPDFSALEWRLGGPNPTIPTDEDTDFHLQHTAAEIPSETGRRLILFDNGEAARGYSRALELAIDPEAGTAEKVWEFRPPNDNWSPIVSLARRMSNGNTFVWFGSSTTIRNSHGPIEGYEVTPEGDVVWQVEMSGYPANETVIVYRATPIGSLAGEVLVGSAR